ncbi:hypothetical protein FB45DRAFT_1021397 [Roridomyces roridus]|uniref:F-box domain-containing protein n=1 Tax=Roridomyces roridus TaxID=1738132 RepID=A0AAD7FYW5_9AGAR|nr:hypothetical protein FB45DRAFT_1021397 [Roridomyces roridus]
MPLTKQTNMCLSLSQSSRHPIPALSTLQPQIASMENDGPSRETVQALIHAAEEDLVDIESKIQNLSRLREEKREVITSLKESIAPIRNVPAELLVEVFQIASAEATFWLDPVLVISHVCAHWRWLACATPRLWAQDLELDFEQSSSASYIDVVKTFLKRSAPLPIPISVYGADSDSDTSPLFQYIRSLAPRWKSMTFQSSDFSGLLSLTGCALKNLESIHLTGGNYFFNRCFPWRFRSSYGHPQCLGHSALRLRFNSDFEHIMIMRFFAPLALPALTTLEIQSGRPGTLWSSQGFTSFQRRSSNIRSLELGGLQLALSDFAALLESSEQLVELCSRRVRVREPCARRARRGPLVERNLEP